MLRAPSSSACTEEKRPSLTAGAMAGSFPPASVLAQLYEEDDQSKGAPVYARGFDTVVTLGRLRSSPGFQVAIKKVAKEKIFDRTHLERCRNEADILRRMAHKHVIPLLDALETEHAFLAVMPYAEKGSLWSYTQHRTVTEFEARNFVSQGLVALEHVHSKGWIHGDVKPHNFLLTAHGDRFAVLLCDFGLAEKTKSATGEVKFTGIRGTSGYFAPEQLAHDDYSNAVDIFAFGVIVYAMLAGFGPFDPPSNFEELEFEPRYWKPMSKEVQDFLTGLLHLDPTQRVTAEAARHHAWHTADVSEEQKVEKFVPPPDFSVKFHHVDSCPTCFTIPKTYLAAKDELRGGGILEPFPNPNEPDEPEEGPSPKGGSSPLPFDPPKRQ